MPDTTESEFPGIWPDVCYVFGNELEYEIQRGDRHRATATRYFADEVGVDFGQVICRRRYLRGLARQEAWERHRENCPEDETDEVPDDWRPDEDDAVWEFCEKTSPGAMSCWHLEERPVKATTGTETTRG